MQTFNLLLSLAFLSLCWAQPNNNLAHEQFYNHQPNEKLSMSAATTVDELSKILNHKLQPPQYLVKGSDYDTKQIITDPNQKHALDDIEPAMMQLLKKLNEEELHNVIKIITNLIAEEKAKPKVITRKYFYRPKLLRQSVLRRQPKIL